MADKYGNRFEGRWTTHCMAEILRGRADRIDLEPPGDAGNGVEFVLRRRGQAEHHQVKGGRSSSWTIRRLVKEGVLGHFGVKLQGDPQCLCVFVSEAPADDLHELSVAAFQASSAAEFDTRLSQELRRAWLLVRDQWGSMTDADAVTAMARVHAKNWPEESLSTLVTVEFEGLVIGPPETARSVLAQFALDRLSGSLTASDIWARLEKEGLRPTDWVMDASVTQAMNRVRDRYLRLRKDEAILGMTLPRQESADVAETLVNAPPSIVLVTGDGGMGKSAVLGAIVESLTDRGHLVLPIRVDALEPTELTRGVGTQLGLPGSPGVVLAALSGGRRSVLVIDQLDSVSSMSGRHPEFWHCLRDVIDEARCHEEVSVLVACHQFDLENDDRLRALSTGTTVVPVGPLSDPALDEVLAMVHVDPAKLRESQRLLLRVPLHLRLFTLVAEEGEQRGLDFETGKDLFDRFWDHKRRRIVERLKPRIVRWGPAIDAACQRMSETETLSIPRSAMEDYLLELDALLSDRVFVEESERIAFFHQAFFDYAFARGFRARDVRLDKYLLGTDQGLFRRSQVKQVLLYERDDDPQRYLQDLEGVLVDNRVRFHLKRATLDLVRSMAAPSDAEWDVLEKASTSNVDVRLHVIDLLGAASAWFDIVLRREVLSGWLRSEDSGMVNEALPIILRMQRSRPKEIADLIAPFLDHSPDWDTRLAWLMQGADLAADRSFFEVFLRLLATGALDGARGGLGMNRDFWEVGHGLLNQQPAWACEFVGAYLARRLCIAEDAGVHNPFDGSAGSIPETRNVTFVVDAARKAPAEFLKHVMPFVRNVIARTMIDSEKVPRPDPVWQWRSLGDIHSLEGAIRVGLECSLRNLAESDPGSFDELASELECEGSETLDFLIARGFVGGGTALANRAMDFLAVSPSRLALGDISNPHLASCELISWASQGCSTDRLQALVDVLLGYYTPYERSSQGRQLRGHAQYVLLSRIPHERLTGAAVRRVQELARKFGAVPVPPLMTISAYTVGSPISQPKAALMSDDQWLRAMSVYNTDRGHPMRGAQGGGAIELSRVLGAQAREHPTRFTELMERAGDDLNPQYFAEVVAAVGDPLAGADMALVVAACSRADRVPGRPCGRAIVRAVQQRASEGAPQELIDMVGRYAVDDPDPSVELWETAAGGGKFFYGGDVCSAGINSNRGAAAQALAAVLVQSEVVPRSLDAVLMSLAQDRMVSVRASTADVLIALLRHDRPRAIDLFLTLVDAREELLATQGVERFLYFTVLTDFERLEPVIQRMIGSPHDDVALAGARQGCLASLELDAAGPIRDACLAGRTALRAGAADIFAVNLRGAGHREACEAALRDMFQHDIPDVAEKAAHAFDSLEGNDLAQFEALAMAFIESPAFEGSYESLLQALRRCDVAVPEVSNRFAERLIEIAGASVSDIRTRQSGDAGHVSELVVRVYSQTNDGGTRGRALDLIDRMSAMQSHGVEASLAAFDRS